MVDKKLSEFGSVSTGDVSYFPVLDNSTKNGKLAATKAMPWTNCITEIPQDINLTLSSGTLTLKAGSKVYVPNGSGTFNVVTVASDVTVTKNSNVPCFVFYKNNTLYVWEVSWATSGTTAPSGTGTWYDTSNNKIKRYVSGSMSAYDLSFPIAIVGFSDGAISSIDQVFNGFGYIGSTVFALPGVKGLIPNGRNADGTLKNTQVSVSSVRTAQVNQYTYSVRLSSHSIQAGTRNLYLNEEENFVYDGTSQLSVLIVGSLEQTSGKITSFTPKTTFHAVDYSEFKAAKDDMMTLSTSQTVSGQKWFTMPTLTDNIYVRGGITLGTSSNVFGKMVQFQDTNGTRIGRVQPKAKDTTNNSTGIYVNNASNNIEMGLEIHSDGFATAPTPSSVTDSSSKVVTTSFIGSKFQVVSEFPANPVNGVFYFITD